MFVAIPDKSTLVFLFFSFNLINLCKQRILWDTFHRCVDVMSPIQEMHQKSCFCKDDTQFWFAPRRDCARVPYFMVCDEDFCCNSWKNIFSVDRTEFNLTSTFYLTYLWCSLCQHSFHLRSKTMVLIFQEADLSLYLFQLKIDLKMSLYSIKNLPRWWNSSLNLVYLWSLRS